jgi:hypothetical protein
VRVDSWIGAMWPPGSGPSGHRDRRHVDIGIGDRGQPDRQHVDTEIGAVDRLIAVQAA